MDVLVVVNETSAGAVMSGGVVSCIVILWVAVACIVILWVAVSEFP
jgi:hypothetical protein